MTDAELDTIRADASQGMDYTDPWSISGPVLDALIADNRRLRDQLDAAYTLLEKKR